MKTLRKLALVVCAFVAIALSSSCNKEEMQIEKLLGKWEVTALIEQEYENGVMVEEIDRLSGLKKEFPEEYEEELVNYHFHFSYSGLTILINGEIEDITLYSIIDGKLIIGGEEYEMKWNGKNNLTFEGKYVDKKNPGNFKISTFKLSRVK